MTDAFIPDQHRYEGWEVTRKTYQDNYEGFLHDTAKLPSKGLQNFYSKTLEYVADDAAILEICSGNGVDALYLESLGYSVERSESVPAFAQYLQKQDRRVRKLDIVQGSLSQTYDLITAMAVFHHLTDEEFDVATKHVLQMLLPYGIFAFNGYSGYGAHFKPYGLGQRYFCYRTPELIEIRMKKAGLYIESIEEVDGWVNCIASK